MSAYVPSRDEFWSACRAYEANESRGPVYFTALNRLMGGWGNAKEMAEAVGILLRSWHGYFYHFGMFDPILLETCIDGNMPALNGIRERDIFSLEPADEGIIRKLFVDFASSLRGGKPPKESGVASAKALHLLAPSFLPLWDSDIAYRYGQVTLWPGYVGFCWQMKEFATAVSSYVDSNDDRSLLKRIDEFNYAVFTKRWVSLLPTGVND